MDTLKEYLKIRSMANAQEISEYLVDSVDTSSLSSFLGSFINYLNILKTIEKEQNKLIWEKYDSIKACYQCQMQEKEQINSPKSPDKTGTTDDTASKEARVIPLFPKEPGDKR